MRLRFREGKQKELLLQFKQKHGLTWKTYAAFLRVKPGALLMWYHEKILLPEIVYEKIDPLKEYEQYLLEKVEENWGRRKGGLLSRGSLKIIAKPSYCAALSELVGIILGDGNIQRITEEKRGVYAVRIAGHNVEDKDYLENYVKPLCEDLFKIRVKTSYSIHAKAMYVRMDSREIVFFLHELGLPIGKKKRDDPRIPAWIRENKEYLRACIRGLFDTDGSVYRMSQQDPNLLRISFTSYYPTLMQDVREAIQVLGFHPSKVICGKQIFLSRQEDIARFLKEVGFANDKHKQRIMRFSSPVV